MPTTSVCSGCAGSRSGYYRWIAGAEARAARQAEEDALVEEIREFHVEHKETYAPCASTPNCAASGTPSTASGSRG